MLPISITHFPGGQRYDLTRTSGGVTETLLSNGAADSTLSTGRGGTVRAGLFDDPFFFDLVGFQNTLDPNSTETFTGDDAFAGANVSAIVFEVPSIDLGNANVNVWATTERENVGQIDRVGRPAINTVLIDSESKDAFNQAQPGADLSVFSDQVNANIAALSNQANADALTGALLPDILAFDTTSSAGFNTSDGTLTLNGRRLADDVIDAELNALTAGNITGDGVDANDVAFSSVFPFLAPAAVAVPEPSTLLPLAILFGAFYGRRRRS